MATADRTLMLKLIADVNQPSKELKGLSGRLKSSARAAARWGKAFAGALVIGGLEKVVDSLGDAEAGFKAGEDAAARLRQTWKTLGRDTDQLAGIMDKLGSSAIDLGFDDAEVLTAFNTFLAKSGSVKDSLAGVTAAENLARAKGIPFSRAVKLVAGQLGDLDKSLKRNKRQAAIWARNHPIEVGLGRISDEWENFVGNFSRGKINRAFAALGNIGKAIADILFGTTDEETGKHTPGLIDRFTAIGGKIVKAIADGMLTLGAEIQRVWDEQIATVDWAKAIPDALASFWRDTLQPFLQNVADKGPIAAAAITAIAVAIGLLALPTIAATAPLILLSLAIGGIVLGIALLVEHLPDIQHALQDVQTKIQPILDGISQAFETTLGHIRNAIGLIQGVIDTAINAWHELDRLLHPARTGPADALRRWLEQHGDPTAGPGGGFAEGGLTPGGMALVGEQGPELVRLPRGSRVFPADETAAMMGAGGGWGGITVNVYAGVGNPVEIGRQVDRVLRAYRGRAGTAA